MTDTTPQPSAAPRTAIAQQARESWPFRQIVQTCCNFGHGDSSEGISEPVHDRVWHYEYPYDALFVAIEAEAAASAPAVPAAALRALWIGPDGETPTDIIRRYAEQVAWPHSGYDPAVPVREWADRLDAALAASPSPEPPAWPPKGVYPTDTRLSDIRAAAAEASREVAAADEAHAAEPEPRAPHEGDYPRGRRDALEWVLDTFTPSPEPPRHDPTDHDCKGGVRGDKYPLASPEPEPLDVERLAEALAFLGEDDILADGSLWKIKEIALNAAAEYARLSQPQEPQT